MHVFFFIKSRYVGSWEGRLHAVDAATGAAQWTYLAGDDLDASPAVADGVVFVAAVASTETNEETTLHAVELP